MRTAASSRISINENDFDAGTPAQSATASPATALLPADATALPGHTETLGNN